MWLIRTLSIASYAVSTAKTPFNGSDHMFFAVFGGSIIYILSRNDDNTRCLLGVTLIRSVVCPYLKLRCTPFNDMVALFESIIVRNKLH